MSFYRSFECLLICVIIIGISEKASSIGDKEEIKKRFVDAINECDRQILPIEGNNSTKTLDSYQNGKILDEIFNLFGYELILVLKKIYNNYVNHIQNGVFDNQYGTTILTESHYTIQILSETEKTICSVILQCADFIFMWRPEISLIFSIAKLHRWLCLTLPELIEHSCTPAEFGDYFFTCQSKIIGTLIQNINSLNSMFTKYPKMFKNDYDIEKFITNIHDIIMQMDKMEIVNNSQLPNNEYIVLPGIFRTHALNDDLIVSTDLRIIFTELNDINNLLYNINSKYESSQETNKCFLPNKLNDIQKLGDTQITKVSEILVHALKGLGYLYRIHTNEFINKSGEKYEQSTIDYNGVKIWMSNMFDGVCKRVPLLLLYLWGNSIKDTESFNYYITFCDEIIMFVISRCPGVRKNTNDGVQHNVNCIVEAIKTKLSIRFPTTTTTTPEVNYESIDLKCANEYLGYISDAHKVLYKYDIGKLQYLWTTCNWLSGKYILAENHDNEAINQIKETVLELNGVQMTLTELYYLILPYKPNVKLLLASHTIICYLFRRQMAVHVVRHAITIIKYLENGYNTGKSAFLSINNSVFWFRNICDKFYSNLNTPINLDPSLYESSIIDQINILKNGELQKIKQLILEDMYQDAIGWAAETTANKLIQNNVEGLNMLAMLNCIDAMQIAYTLLSISQHKFSSCTDSDCDNNLKTNYNQIHISNKYQHYCQVYVKNMFVGKSTIIRPSRNIK